MKRTPVFLKDLNKLGKDEINDFISLSPVDNKKVILDYMRSFNTPVLFTSQPVKDAVSGEELKRVDNGYSDGVYLWFESDIYHFENYNLKLEDDFINYILDKTT